MPNRRDTCPGCTKLELRRKHDQTLIAKLKEQLETKDTTDKELRLARRILKETEIINKRLTAFYLNVLSETGLADNTVQEPEQVLEKVKTLREAKTAAESELAKIKKEKHT